MYDMLRIGLFLLYGCLLLKNSSALTCFNCPGIRHPRFCEFVKDCLDGQVCGLERQVESNGAVIFSLGCLSQNTCNTNPSIVDGRQKCFHCCSTDLCNINGCGEPGLSMANDKVCYSCLGLLDPKACRSVSFCEKSEMCYLEEKTHFGEKFYQSGCREKHICESQLIAFPIIGRRDLVRKRSTTHMTCCGQSLCNNKGFGIKKTTLSSKLSTSDGASTSVITTKLPDICALNRMCYNGATCQFFNESYRCICAVGYLGKKCEYSDGKDTSFMVIFHQGHPSAQATPGILVASENTTRLSIFSFNNSSNQSITIDKTYTDYDLSNNSVIPSDGIHLAGVELHSDSKVNVYGYLYESYYSDAFLSMPMRFGSTKYIISTLPSYISYNGYSNILVLTPVYQNTIVNINLKLESGYLIYENNQYRNNDTIRVLINKYNTFQLSTKSDISGTMVTTSKPVVVVSGNQCNTALPKPAFLGNCGPFIEMALPTDQLDNLFITPHISKRLNNTVRIQAVNSTNLNINFGNQKYSRLINARDSWDFYYSTISLILASDDVLVISYPHGISRGKGDPFMMTIPGVNQYLNEYDFVVPTKFVSFISITVKSSALDGFLMDGKSFSISNVSNILEGLNNFSTFSLPVSAGFHHMEHTKQVRFGLWVYGNQDSEYSGDGYGYPAGMAYKIFN